MAAGIAGQVQSPPVMTRGDSEGWAASVLPKLGGSLESQVPEVWAGDQTASRTGPNPLSAVLLLSGDEIPWP